jgi:broad specificity phosphatase PhoE
VETLLLARHGFAGSNRDDVASCAIPGEGLTPEGVEQARSLGASLVETEIALGATTELSRTNETLRLALEGRDVPTIVVPELNEIHFGSFDGGALETYRAWAAAHSPSVSAPGGGESRAEAAARFAHGLRLLLAREEEAILLVGHALALRSVVDAADALVPAARMAPVAHAQPFRLAREDVARAAELLEGWSAAPRFRDGGGTMGA